MTAHERSRLKGSVGLLFDLRSPVTSAWMSKCSNDYSVCLERVNSCKLFPSANVNESAVKDNPNRARTAGAMLHVRGVVSVQVLFPGEAASPDRSQISDFHRRVTSHCSSNLNNPGCTRLAAYVTRFTSSLSSCPSHKENMMGGEGMSPTWTPKIELAQLKHPHQIQVKDWPQLSGCRQNKTNV